MSKKIKTKTDVKAKTVLQTFADYMAKGVNDRDELFEVSVTDRSLVIVRHEYPKNTN